MLPRSLLPALLLLLLAGAREARAAEEIFVLDNGSVFRGQVLRTEDGVLRVRLTDFSGDATVSFEASRIVNRYAAADPPPRTVLHRTDPVDAPFADWSVRTTAVTAPTIEPQPSLPAEEPAIRDEGFFRRLARVASLSLPTSLGGQTGLALLVLAALYAFVLLGGRLAEIETMGFGSAASLAVLLGAMLAADVVFHPQVLRADRASWLLPLQGLVWLSTAGAILRCGVARTILLFAFVLFGLTVLVFAAGTILVVY